MALYYPQLPAGCVVQFPYRRRTRARTVVAEVADGSQWKQVDDLWKSSEWLLRYTNLSEPELASLEDFFEECEGRLKTFTFFDPNGNLLMWSQDFGNAAWHKSGALTLAAGMADPFGGMGATRASNAGGSAQIYQAAGIPGRYHTCYSIWLRASAPSAVRVWKRSGAEVDDEWVTAGSAWKRVSIASALGGTAETQEAGIELPAGVSVDLFGAQMEAQPAMSAYRKSAGLSGVHTRARFASDELTCVAEAPGLYSVGLRIIAY